MRLQIGLTRQQIAAQDEQIKSFDAEIAGSQTLVDRGLMAAPALARLQRQVSDEQTLQLRLRTNLAETQRLMAGLERELLGLDFKRAQTWRQDLAESGARTDTLTATRASIEDRLALLQDWSVRSTKAEAEARFDYAVRRQAADGTPALIPVEGTAPVLPGDTVIVRLHAEPVPDAIPGAAGAADGASPGVPGAIPAPAPAGAADASAGPGTAGARPVPSGLPG